MRAQHTSLGEASTHALTVEQEVSQIQKEEASQSQSQAQAQEQIEGGLGGNWVKAAEHTRRKRLLVLQDQQLNYGVGGGGGSGGGGDGDGGGDNGGDNSGDGARLSI